MRHSTLTGLPSCLRSSFTTGSYGAGSVYCVSEEEELKARAVTPKLSLMGGWEVKSP